MDAQLRPLEWPEESSAVVRRERARARTTAVS